MTTSLPGGGGQLCPSSLRHLTSTAPLQEKLHGALTLACELLPPSAAAQLRTALSEPGGASASQQHAQHAAQHGHQGAAGSVQNLPPAVHAHYLQSLCDWAVSSLTRSATGSHAAPAAAAAATEGSLKATSKKRPAPEAAPQQQAPGLLDAVPACADVRLWRLAAALLAAGAQPPPASVVSAAAAACRLATGGSGHRASQHRQQLMDAVHAVLGMASQSHAARHACGPRDWQPPLESTGDLLTALLACSPYAHGSTTAATSQDGCVAESEAWRVTWAALTHLTLKEMLTSVQEAQSPRKALAAVLSPSVLHALLRLAFPVSVSRVVLGRLLQPSAAAPPTAHAARHANAALAGHGGAVPQSSSLDLPAQLQAAAQRVLEASLLHEAHVAGLAEAAQQMVLPVLAGLQRKAPGAASGAAAHTGAVEAAQQAGQASGAGGERLQGGGSAAGGESAGLDVQLSSVRSYHASIFEALLGAIQLEGSSGVRGSALACLPWLLEAASHAFARLRRIQGAESSTALRVALAHTSRGAASTKRGADEEEEGAQPSQGAAAAGEGPLRQAEFQLLAALACLLLPLTRGVTTAQDTPQAGGADDGAAQPGRKRSRKDRVKGAAAVAAGSGAGPVSRWDPDLSADVVYGLAALLSCAKAAHAYEPTQDFTQLHRAFLTRLTTSILTTTDQPPAPDQPAAAQPAASAVLTALCSAVCAVLQLEYRALTASLPALWQLLTDTASSSTAPQQVSSQAWPAASAAVATTPQGGSGDSRSNRLLAVAAACACQLIVAYAELRQLHVLLESLADALLVAVAAGSASQSAAGRCLPQLVLQPSVLHTLSVAVAALPPGQGAPLLSGLSAHLQPLSAHSSHTAGTTTLEAVHLAAGALTVTCIQAVRLELPTAIPLAAACQQLISHLAAPLVTLVARACKKDKGRGQRDHQQLQSHEVTLLTMQLQMYAAATSLYGRCVALNPEVPQSPAGQAAGAPTSTASGGEVAAVNKTEGGAAAAGGSGSTCMHSTEFFAAALHAAGAVAAQSLHKAAHKAGVKLCRESQAAPDSLPAQGGEDTVACSAEVAAADALLVLASRQYLPAVQEAAASGVPGARAVGGQGHAQAAAQVALAHAVHGCLLQHASLLHDRMLLLSGACMPAGGRAALDQRMAHVRLELGALIRLLLPHDLLTAPACGPEHDSTEAEAAATLPPWLHHPAPDAAASLPLLVAGMSPAAGQDGVEAVRGVLLSGVWAGALQAVSCWGPGPWLPADLTRAVLQLQLGSHAAAQAATRYQHPGHGADGQQRQPLLQRVAWSSCRVLQGLPGWQALPHVSQQLLPAFTGVSCSLAARLAAQVQAALEATGQQLQGAAGDRAQGGGLP